MGYRDDFYKAENIIGYTGSLHDFPSVYFQTEAERGHITQKHPTLQNIGRGTVKSSEGYKLENVMVNGELRLVESLNGKPFHTSRGTLTTLEGMSSGDKAILAQAIWAFPEQKLIPTFSKKDHQIIKTTKSLHDLLMTELMEEFAD